MWSLFVPEAALLTVCQKQVHLSVYFSCCLRLSSHPRRNVHIIMYHRHTIHAVEEYLFKHGPEEAVSELGLLLKCFGSPSLMMLLNGRWSAFDALSMKEREASLQEFKGSFWEPKRKAFCALKVFYSAILSIMTHLTSFLYPYLCKGVICLKAFTIMGGSSDRRANPNWSAMGYDGPEESPRSVTQEYMYSMINSTMNEDCTLEYDVVVVGSGCGGEVFRGAKRKSGC
jgi:hypothetical protein